MPKRKSTEEIKNKIEKYTLNEFTLVGEYKNKSIGIEIKHNKCGGIFKQITGTFFDNFKCKCCGEQFDINRYFNINNKDDLLKKLDNEFELVGEYKGIYETHTFKHKICGHLQDVKTFKMLINPICLQCNGGFRVDNDLFMQRIYKLYNTEFVPLSEYKGSKANVTFFHAKCKRQFQSDGNKALTNKLVCSRCHEDSLWNTDKLQKEINKLTSKNEYTILEKYKDYETPIKFKHNICGNTFELSPNVFMKTPKCPICEGNISLGEKRVGDILKKYKIPFEREYIFKECKHIYSLRFDFAVFKNADKKRLNYLIEYDGEHHYFPMYGIERLKSNQERDLCKNTYCKDNNIILIRIPYWEFDNIEKFLRKELKKNNIKLN